MKNDREKLRALLPTLTKDALHHTIIQLHNLRAESRAHHAVLCLMAHVANCWKMIFDAYGLAKDEPSRQVIANPAAILSRSMYDAYLQASYILQDSLQSEARAVAYLEFIHVEKYNYVSTAIMGSSQLAKVIACSPRRATAEPQIQQEYKRVVGNYRNAKGKPRKHWYAQNDLRTLAKDIGLEEEYVWHFTMSNSAVHAGPLATATGPSGPVGADVAAVTAMIAMQMVNLARDRLKIPMLPEIEEFAQTISRDVIHL
ncbi:MAG: hypothetical protein FLDDKLPJ_01643 [Phycisphaerae bacterium]|nr:hypothetical protein [Phycisphaerae bacterium]